MTDATEAVLFNAVPLLLLTLAYAAVTGAVLPSLWREREDAQLLDYALVLLFGGVAVAGLIFGILVLRDRQPFGGHVWLSLAGTLAALVPAVLLLALWRDRAHLVGGMGRMRRAERRVSVRDRELESVAEISSALGRAREPVEVARPLVRRVAELLDVGFAGVALVSPDGGWARGLYAEAGGEPLAAWLDVRVDLRGEPSGISSAVLDATPVAVFDVASSSLVSPRLAKLVSARSGVFIPLIAEERVIAVIVLASTDRKRTFPPDELALLQAVAGEAALALARLRSADELAAALAREQTIARIAHAVRAELDPSEVVRVGCDELRRALTLDAAELDLRPDAEGGVPVELHGERIGTLRTRRKRSLTAGERLLVETAAREIAAALQTARLVAENRRRLEQQAALLAAAQVVTSELDLEAVLQRLVEQVTKLLDADAADCYLLDRERGALRCAAVHGFDASLVGLELAPERGMAAALPVEGLAASGEARAAADPVPHAAYAGFRRALVAPMVWAGETRGVLGIGVRQSDRAFAEADLELLEAFASLASLALRNAETFAERSRQARVQRGFYRIAELLGEPLSLDETYDAAAQAAADALGADYAAVLMQTAAGFALMGGNDLPPQVRALPVSAALVQVAHDGQVLASAQLADDERFDPAWRAGPFASLLAIPIPGDPAGLVLVLFREERELARDDLELAQQLASATRGALDRSRLFEAERAARSLSQQLARTYGLLATELDPGAVLEAVVAEAAELLDADGAALASLEGDELVLTAAVGSGAEAAIGLRAPCADWLAGEVVQSRAPVVLDDVQAEGHPRGTEPLLAAGHRAYLGVPLAGREGALQGVLAVVGQAPRAWRPDEVQALAALAANASSTLTNAELYQRVAVEREQSVAILANIADGIVAVDRDGDVVVWNRAAAEITGVPAREAIGRPPAQVLQRDLQSSAGDDPARLVSIMRGGQEVWLSLSEAVMRDPAGAVAGRIYAFRDISAERAVEQMKSDFVSTVSHELRTPLTSIYGFAQTLLREDIAFGDEERRTFMGYIARESERLTEIVDALLNVARLDTGDLRVALQPTDVSSVVGEVVAAADENGHRFVAEVPEPSLRVRADPDKLRQVLDQLISNALKYSPDGGTVTVSAFRRASAVELAVADEGLGIPAAERERIFSKFYKGGNGQTRGTGLGLFIAQGLVREMGGRIWVDSEEGRGSRFAFELPLAQDPLEA